MAQRLNQKVAVITGAARGIGRATSELFTEHGATVIGIDRHPDETQPLAMCLRGDITDAEAIAQAMAEVAAHFGRIDVLINNAGVNVFDDPLQLSDADWERCLSINLKGAWNLCRAVLPWMLAQGAGAIVNIASVHAHRIIPGAFPYPVAKHGLIGLTRALAIQYAAQGIRVNSISPGLIETPQIEAWLASQPDPVAARAHQANLLPCKRIGRPEEVAHTALFLASDEAPFINGADILIDGGRSQLYHE